VDLVETAKVSSMWYFAQRNKLNLQVEAAISSTDLSKTHTLSLDLCRYVALANHMPMS
jgi:hypothetical protein